MTLRWQSLILISFILISVTVIKLGDSHSRDTAVAENRKVTVKKSSTTASNLLTFGGSALADDRTSVEKVPVRKWDVLDPDITADSVIVHSLDDKLPFFYYNSHEQHVLASLTKLLTAVVVFEDVGLNKKISISKKAVETRGLAGSLSIGEVYTARDLAKLMLLTSSNDAAAAFEEYFGGKEEFVSILEDKMKKIGMNSTVLHGGSGLSDYNVGTASDFLKLSRYILRNHPRIFSWTRNSEMLIQPINRSESRKEHNINSLVSEKDYLGGKTGTSRMAGQNLVALFNLEGRKVLVILLDSDDRDQEALRLIDWTKKAYKFN